MGTRDKRRREEPSTATSPFTDTSLAEFTSSGSDLRLRCKDGRVLPVHMTILQLASRSVLKDILEHSEPGAVLQVWELPPCYCSDPWLGFRTSGLFVCLFVPCLGRTAGGCDHQLAEQLFLQDMLLGAFRLVS
jgi:hypothetical protein